MNRSNVALRSPPVIPLVTTRPLILLSLTHAFHSIDINDPKPSVPCAAGGRDRVARNEAVSLGRVCLNQCRRPGRRLESGSRIRPLGPDSLVPLFDEYTAGGKLLLCKKSGGHDGSQFEAERVLCGSCVESDLRIEEAGRREAQGGRMLFSKDSGESGYFGKALLKRDPLVDRTLFLRAE